MSEAAGGAGPVRAQNAERITYLIANHNRARYLRDCLSSLLTQTRGDWLALIADDASTDDSVAVMRSVADPRIRVLEGRHNVGYVATLQRLIDEVATDIVAILDADDALAPEATAVLLEAYASHEGAAFVYSRFGVYDEALAVCRAVYGGPLPPAGTALLEGPVGAIRSFRLSAYRSTTGLDPAMLYAEDRDLVYKLEEVSRPLFVDALLYRYRALPGSQSRDAAKREIGLRNTLAARRAALRRRGVKGLARLLWESWARLDFAAASGSPNALTSLARLLGRGAAWLLRRSRTLRGAGLGGWDGRVRAGGRPPRA